MQNVVNLCVYETGIATSGDLDNGRTKSKHCSCNIRFIRCTSVRYCVFFVSGLASYVKPNQHEQANMQSGLTWFAFN